MGFLRFAVLLPTSVFLSTLPSCSSTPPPPAVCSAPQGSAGAARALATAETQFAMSLYGPVVATTGAASNAIFSPYGASAVLTMVDVGAAGATDAQMESVLHLPSAAPALASAYAALACSDETDGAGDGNQLSIASALFAQQGFPFEKSFITVLAHGYDAPLQEVDFEEDPSGATSTVNQWVSNETQGKIPSILMPGDVDSRTRLVLANALYFRGSWASAFDPGETGPQTFTLADGTTAEVTTMENDDATVGTTTQGDLTVVELPYMGGSMVMDFLVPSGVPLSQLETEITASQLGTALGLLTQSRVSLFVPKFSFTTRLDLVPILEGMGMTAVFDPTQANLSGIDGNTDLFVKTTIQQALVEVDEQGTVAAAATESSGSSASVSVAPPPPLRIDQPFMLLIRDTHTGSILFMGRVEDPRAAM